jgi:hypothetical protein
MSPARGLGEKGREGVERGDKGGEKEGMTTKWQLLKFVCLFCLYVCVCVYTYIAKYQILICRYIHTTSHVRRTFEDICSE